MGRMIDDPGQYNKPYYLYDVQNSGAQENLVADPQRTSCRLNALNAKRISVTRSALTAVVSIPSSPIVDVVSPNNLVDHVAKSPSLSKNVFVHSEEDVVYLSPVQRKVSSSDNGDDVLYEPPEEKSDMRVKENYPEMERARKGAQPSTSRVDKDSNFVDAQSISDSLECRLCGQKVLTKNRKDRM
uniref:Uncharacterized protein n=1 Tax=Ditylenchus dipsaci TaxID=166011 RepID=A0A915DXS1_9BILA